MLKGLKVKRRNFHYDVPAKKRKALKILKHFLGGTADCRSSWGVFGTRPERKSEVCVY
jgi:hypothetical protein